MRMSITRLRNSYKGGHGHEHVMHPGLLSQAGFCANTQTKVTSDEYQALRKKLKKGIPRELSKVGCSLLVDFMVQKAMIVHFSSPTLTYSKRSFHLVASRTEMCTKNECYQEIYLRTVHNLHNLRSYTIYVHTQSTFIHTHSTFIHTQSTFVFRPFTVVLH
jgi:hypothetical protein